MAKRPHHHHALVKASAKHLHTAGHITAEHRDKIFKSAERGMKAARQPTPAPMAAPAAPMGPSLMPGTGGSDIEGME